MIVSAMLDLKAQVALARNVMPASIQTLTSVRIAPCTQIQALALMILQIVFATQATYAQEIPVTSHAVLGLKVMKLERQMPALRV